MLAIAVDGRVVGDVVAVRGARPSVYRVALGRVRERHAHRLDRARPRAVAARGPPGARGQAADHARPAVRPRRAVRADPLRPRPAGDPRALREQPHRRAAARLPHVIRRTPRGRPTIEYTVIWSNEDGGTDTPALMARWGRTTDIEWIYRVTLDRRGRKALRRLPGARPRDPARSPARASAATRCCGPARATTTWLPVAARGRGLALPLPARHRRRSLPAGRAREAMMDANPWTYQVMAKEMAREGKLESPASPDTPALSDQRDYLFAEVKKTTAYPVAPPRRQLGRRRARGPAPRQRPLVTRPTTACPTGRSSATTRRRRRSSCRRGRRGRRRGGQGRRGPGRHAGRLHHHGHRAAPGLPAAPRLPARQAAPELVRQRHAEPGGAGGRALARALVLAERPCWTAAAFDRSLIGAALPARVLQPPAARGISRAQGRERS